MLVTHDLHCHSWTSTCATSDCTLEAHVAAAVEAGLTLIGITDHIHGYDEKRLADILALARRVRAAAWPIDVRVGAELSLLAGGRLPMPMDRLRELDYVLVSTNHTGVPGVEEPRAWTPAGVADWLLDSLAAAIELRPLAVAHPFNHGYVHRVEREAVLAALDRDRIRALFGRAAEVHVAMELNARKVRSAPAFYGEVIDLAQGVGERFILCSDAHDPDEMAYGGAAGRRQYEDLLRGLGLTAEQVWSEVWGAMRPTG